MAKKKTALSIEERLQQALVPKEEQPYEVPENWVWCKLGSVANWGSGGTPSRKHAEYYKGNIPWIKTGELKNDWIFNTEEHINQDAIINSSAKLYPINTIVIAMYGATIGKVGIMGVEATTNQACACAVCTPCIGYRFLFWYCLSQKQIFIDKGKGGAQPNISQIIIKEHSFCLPPINEQHRIVARIEELFAKLDEAKENLQLVIDGFENRKAAILHKAFTGELTKRKGYLDVGLKIVGQIIDNRESLIKKKEVQRAKLNPITEVEMYQEMPKGWRQVKLGEVCFVTKLAGFEYTKYFKLQDVGDVPVLRAQNVRKGHLDTENLLYIDRETSEKLGRSALDKKCVLITFIGAGIGDVCVFERLDRYHLAPNVAKIEPYNSAQEELNVYFIQYYLLSFFGQREIFKNMKATAQPSLSMETIRDIVIPIPNTIEQREIVRIVDSLLDKEQKAKEAAESVLEQIDLMKKSILARAFRGELGTNDPAEPSSMELLKQVLADKE